MTSPYPIPGSVYKLRDGLAVDTLADPAVDQKLLKVTAVICTPAIDRQGEIIIPGGGNYENYKKNPVILWEHGFDGQITTPIAKCETPDGQLALRASEQMIEADSFFIPSDKPSSQIFNLIVERVIRATSIHVLPASKVQKTIDGDTITAYSEWEMLEFSWGKIGVNPEAVRKILDCGKLDGCEIIPSIAKMLRPWAATRKGNGVGFDFGKAKSMTPEEEAAAKKAAEAPPELPPEETPAEEVPAEEPAKQQKPSAAYCSAVVESLTQLLANIDGGLDMIENPVMEEYANGEGREVLQMAIDGWNAKLSEVGGKSVSSEAPDEPADEEAVKSWLAGGVGRGGQLAGQANQIKTIAKSVKPLTPGQKRDLERIGSHLERIEQGSRGIAKSLKGKAESATEVQLTEAVVELAGVFKAANSNLASLVPAKS